MFQKGQKQGHDLNVTQVPTNFAKTKPQSAKLDVALNCE